MFFFTVAVALWNISPWRGGHRWDADVQMAGCRVQHHPSSPDAQWRAFSLVLEPALSFSLSKEGAWGKPAWRQNWLVTCQFSAWHGFTTEQPGGLHMEQWGGHSCIKISGAKDQNKPRYRVLSQRPCHFKLILSNITSFGQSHGYTACSSWPLAGWLAKRHRFWQMDTEHDGERLLLSLAGCFPEFLLEGNVFILWNSCSLKIKTEHEHRSSVCPLGCYVPSGKQEVGAVFSQTTRNEQCCYVDTLAEESKALQCTNDTVLFFISL